MTKRLPVYLRSAVLFALLVFPNIYACFAASDLSSPGKTLAYLLVVSAGLMLPMVFLRRRTYFIVTGVLCIFCAPIELASLYLNHNPATATFVGLFYATNREEAAGVIGAVWPLLAVLAVVWTAYFYMACKQPNEWMIPRRTGLWAAGIGLPVLFAGGIIVFSRYARDIYNIQQPKEVLSLAKELTVMKLYKIFPYNIYLNTCRLASEWHEIRQAQERLSSFRFGIAPCENTEPELYILVIGEAARSSHFALNGYARPTTPRLSGRSNLVSFPNIYAQAGTTEQSVPHMISRLPVTRTAEVHTEKTLPEAFQEAGFRTAWLTNQSRILHLQRVLGTADVRFETGKDMSVTGNYDEYLLAPLQKVIANGGKQFVVVHTMGSHWRYDTRYPVTFKQFTPDLGEDFRLNMISPANRTRLVNAYDNTILYTDFFLDSLLSIVERLHIPAVVMYQSDHGENLYDDERRLVLHGNYSAGKWLFHVPFIIWYSDEYAALHPEKTQQLQAHADCCDNSSTLFPSLMDAAGLHYINDTTGSTVVRTRSIFSSGYCPPDTLFVMTAEGECIVLEER